MLAFLLLLAILSTFLSRHSQAQTFTNPLKTSDRSDPFMVHYEGYYYPLTTTWLNVQITRATTISGLKTASPTISHCCNVWAPELHQIDGSWYMYYTVGVSSNINNQHINVLQGGSNPMDSYAWRSTIIPDIWAIDLTVDKFAGSCYIFFSAFSPNNLQSLYVARMSNPLTVTDAGWTDGYSLGQLTWTGTDPLSVSSWLKYTAGPDFAKANGDYGPGHNDFFASPDESTTYIVYHASERSDVAYDGTRRTFAQPVDWYTDGSPNIPKPISDLIPSHRVMALELRELSRHFNGTVQMHCRRSCLHRAPLASFILLFGWSSINQIDHR
ncbi:hypothetical protein ACEPAG_6790 [Sanghuangporus baumii]